MTHSLSCLTKTLCNPTSPAKPQNPARYRESQPLVHHLTPFEQRVAAKLTEEQQVAAAAAAASGGLQDGSIKQKLFAAGDGNGRDVDAA